MSASFRMSVFLVFYDGVFEKLSYKHREGKIVTALTFLGQAALPFPAPLWDVMETCRLIFYQTIKLQEVRNKVIKTSPLGP